MIEIIKEGTRKITTCNICGCEFSFEVEDIETSYTEVFNAIAPRRCEYVACPQCNNKIILKAERGI